MTGMLGVLRLLHQRTGGLAVDRGEADRRGVLVERGLQHLDLLLDVSLGVGSLEGDLDVELLGGLLGAGLHGLPELVPESLRDERHVRLVAVAAARFSAASTVARAAGEDQGCGDGADDGAHECASLTCSLLGVVGVFVGWCRWCDSGGQARRRRSMSR